jgi:hypothetical protein
MRKISEQNPLRFNVEEGEDEVLFRISILLKSQDEIVPGSDISIEALGVSPSAEHWEEVVTDLGKTFCDNWIRDDREIGYDLVQVYDKTLVATYSPNDPEGKVFQLRDKSGFSLKLVRQGDRGKLEVTYPDVGGPATDSPVTYILDALRDRQVITENPALSLGANTRYSK